MKVSPTYYDEIFSYKGEWDMPSSCGLKIVNINERIFVIVTELYQDNPGTSVTYAGEKLFAQICESKKLDKALITYIECNPNTNSKLSFYDEEYFEVDFSSDISKRYRQLTKEEISEIFGKPLQYLP